MADGEITWWELDVPDVQGAQQFYGAITPWSFETMQGFESYVIVKNGDRQIGAIQASDAGEPAGRRVMLYVEVSDLEDTLRRAAAAGGTVEQERQEVPGNQWFGLVRDPFGLRIGFLTSNPAG